MPVGIPTSVAFDSALDVLLGEFNFILIQSEKIAREARVAMAAGAVPDSKIRDVWNWFADAEFRINEMRRSPTFHDSYAEYRGLSYAFNCTNDVNAANDRITGLPDNHRFKADHRVDFVLIDGALPGNVNEDTNYFIREVGLNYVTITNTEGGGSNVNLLNGLGTARMVLNIKPDLGSLRTNIDLALDEIELNLTQRATVYDRPNVSHTYSTRSTVETATLRTRLQDIENLIDVTPG